MPPRPHKVCRRAGCSALTQNRNGYCDQCQAYAEQQEKKRLAISRVKADEKRGSSAQRGYGGKWRKERVAYLREHPLCAECQRRGRLVPATVVDHVVPHRGDVKLFWKRSNWQPLCDSCHRKKTARGE